MAHGSANAPEPRRTRGRLLVAAPELVDPNFERSVVLVLEHNAGGAFGLVLDRPGDAALSDVLEPWVAVAAPPTSVFDGGPVEPGAAFCLGVTAAPVSALPDGVAVVPCDGDGDDGAASASICTVDLDAVPGEVAAVARVRVFSGCAGWSPGQLDSELREGSWYVVDAVPSDVVTSDPSGLWRAVLRRQRAPLSWVANFPDDPDDN